ncbi:MAG: hypothetical protein RL095_3845 [Verrucomicrobiota bacterium]|jgi:hypothetical protein
MGFMDSMWSAAKKVGNAVSEKSQEVQETKARLEYKDDNALIRMYFDNGFTGPTATEKMVILSILKDRGYSAEDIKAKKP